MIGFTNAVRALGVWVKASGAPIDEDAFERVAEEVGDATPEQIKNGFVVGTIEDAQKLCDIAEVCIYVEHKTGLVTVAKATPELHERLINGEMYD